MVVPIAVIIRFSGDPDEVLARFERVRQMWIEAQPNGYERPVFYAACRTDDGIAIVTGWETAIGHRAFGEQLHPLIEDVGLQAPDRVERMRIEKLGWG